MTGVKRLSVTSLSLLLSLSLSLSHTHIRTHRLAMFKGLCPKGMQRSTMTGDMWVLSFSLISTLPLSLPLSFISVAAALSARQSFRSTFSTCVCVCVCVHVYTHALLVYHAVSNYALSHSFAVSLFLPGSVLQDLWQASMNTGPGDIF